MAVTAAPLGDAAVRCVVDDLAQAHALHAAVTNAQMPGVVNVVPTWRCVVVTVADPVFVPSVLDFVVSVDVAAALPRPAREHQLTIHYDGEDLDDVAARCGIGVATFTERHSQSDYVVAFLGFAPGFAYLSGLPAALSVPRRATPRARVPAGSVGIADGVTGIYPAALPGGWQLIGHVDERLFDGQLTPPALLAPGDRVRFMPA